MMMLSLLSLLLWLLLGVVYDDQDAVFCFCSMMVLSLLFVVVCVVCSRCDDVDRISNYIELGSYLPEVRHRERALAATDPGVV